MKIAFAAAFAALIFSTSAFADADPAEVVSMRTEMINLLKNPSTSIPFRREFGAEFARAFQRFPDSKDAMRAANASFCAAPT